MHGAFRGFSVLSSQFSVLGSQFSVLGSRFFQYGDFVFSKQRRSIKEGRHLAALVRRLTHGSGKMPPLLDRSTLAGFRRHFLTSDFWLLASDFSLWTVD
jgi:hypothetical protein